MNKIDMIRVKSIGVPLSGEGMSSVLYNENLLTADSVSTLYNPNDNSGFMMYVKVREWHDTECAYNLINMLKSNVTVSISSMFYDLEISILKEEVFNNDTDDNSYDNYNITNYCENYDIRLEMMHMNDKIQAESMERKLEEEWLDNYMNDSLYDDLTRSSDTFASEDKFVLFRGLYCDAV